jgi:hypothetical protein
MSAANRTAVGAGMRLPPLATLAHGGQLAFVALVALAHPLRGDLPAPDHFVSEYASGSTEALAIAAFLSWGLAMVAAAALAWRRGLRAVPVLLVVAALGAGAAAGFDTQTVAGELPAGAIRTDAGRLHDQGTLAIFAGLLGAVIWALRALRTRRYRLGLLACAAALVAAPAVLVAAGLDWPGVGQRAIVLTGVAALALLVSELARRGPRTPARARG